MRLTEQLKIPSLISRITLMIFLCILNWLIFKYRDVRCNWVSPSQTQSFDKIAKPRRIGTVCYSLADYYLTI